MTLGEKKEEEKKTTPHLVCMWSLFHSQRNILFEFISSLSSLAVWVTVVDHLKWNPGFAYISQKQHHFKSLPLSALYIDIYLFFEIKKKTKRLCTLWDDVASTWVILHRWGELMVFIQFIFYTLCTLIHTDADIQLVLCFTRHWFFFPGGTSITLSHGWHAELPEREM